VAVKDWNSQIDNVIRILGGIMAKVPESPWTQEVYREGLHSKILAAIRSLQSVRAHDICPQCKGKKGGCKLCHKTRWLPKVVWEHNTPPKTVRIIERMEKEAGTTDETTAS
jgi:hypothetical protein